MNMGLASEMLEDFQSLARTRGVQSNIERFIEHEITSDDMKQLYRKYGTRNVAIKYKVRGAARLREGREALEVETRGWAEISGTVRRLMVCRAKILLTSSNTSMNSSGLSAVLSVSSLWNNSFITFPRRPCKDKMISLDIPSWPG